MAPAGGSMIGMGRTVSGGHTIEFEYLRIEERGGQIYYVASPKGRCPGTDFKLTRLRHFPGSKSIPQIVRLETLV